MATALHDAPITARLALTLGVFVWLLLAGCGQRDDSQKAQPPAGANGGANPAAEMTAVPPDTTPASSDASSTEEVRPKPDDSPVIPEPRAQDPTPTPRVVDPGGVVEVKATKPGLSRIGPEKCKVCHQVQFESWSASAHAKRTPPVDCESCHGAGSEFKFLSVMKDPEKARAAGLVLPTRDFCATCHRTGWSDGMLARVHAHKPAAGAN